MQIFCRTQLVTDPRPFGCDFAPLGLNADVWSHSHSLREEKVRASSRRLLQVQFLRDIPPLDCHGDRCAHGMGMVGFLRWRSRRRSFGRSLNQLTKRASCLTASSYACLPFSALASSASPNTPVLL